MVHNAEELLKYLMDKNEQINKVLKMNCNSRIIKVASLYVKLV